MVATLLGADRSPARGATRQPVSARSGTDEASALTEAVFRLLGDGKRRTRAEIASALEHPTTSETIADEIARLQRYGVAIEDEAGVVVATPYVPLDLPSLTRALADTWRTAWTIEVVFATQSTNADLLAAVRTQVPAGPVVRATELQLGGRGRLGRRWSSAPGRSLTASFAVTVRRRLAALDGATLVCGLAVRDVLDELGVAARLKWPNDVLVDGRKLAGILVEAHAAGESSSLVIGIGVNVAGASIELDPDARPGALRPTTLEEAGARGVDRNLLVARLARSLEAHLQVFEASGFAGFVGRWNAVDAFADRCVTLEAGPDSRRTGTARGIDERGALLVDVDGRRERVVAGEVSLRAADGAWT